MIILKIILIPVSLSYQLIIFVRNKFYDYGIFKTYRLSKPVISIGNITTGGTGKTPLTLYIAKYLLGKNIKTGIISRGYKRKSDDILTVCDGEKLISGTDESGDELVMISEELLKDYKNFFYIVAGSKRIKAGNYLLDKFDADVIILDDGFQHRSIHRDADIVIMDASDYFTNMFGNIFTLPSGNLREGYSGLKRADLIIQNNKANNFETITQIQNYGKEVIIMRYKTEYFMDYKNIILQVSKNENLRAVVFSGIANDESFIKMIEAEGIQIICKSAFPDHYNYKSEDIKSLKSKFNKGDIFITTEKDFVKVKEFSDFVSEYPVYFLKLKTEITNGEEILKKLLDRTINENRNNQSRI